MRASAVAERYIFRVVDKRCVMYGKMSWQELQDNYIFESKRLNKVDREQSFKLIRREINRRLRSIEQSGSRARGIARKQIAEQRRSERRYYKRK